MSKDWTTEEFSAASDAIKAAEPLSCEEEKVLLTIADFAKIQKKNSFPCPRCGHFTMDIEDPIRNALSRHADVMVCDVCGTDEAVRDYTGDVLPVTEWAIAKYPGMFAGE